MVVPAEDLSGNVEPELTDEEKASESAFKASFDESDDGFSKVKVVEDPPAEPTVDKDDPDSASTVADEGKTEPTVDEAAADDADGDADPDLDKDPAPASSDLKIVLERLDGLDTKLGQVDQTSKTALGRSNSLHKALNDAQRGADRQGADTPSPEQVAEASKDAEDWKALKETFPEWGEGFDKHLAFLTKQMEDKIPNMEGFVSKDEAADMVDAAVSKVRLDIVHPGWPDTVKSAEFKAFRDGNPTADALGSSSNVADAVKMLDMYKESQKEAQKKSEDDAAKDDSNKENDDRLAANLQIDKPKANKKPRGDTAESAFVREFNS